MADPLDLLEVSGRLLVAVAAGAAIGWEREVKDKPAGLRTHMLVALGAAVAVLAGVQFGAELDKAEQEAAIARIIQGVVGGVGFLGAGSIIQSRGAVRGITTAASIWIVAAIGIAGGLGMFSLIGVTTAIALFILHGVGLIERRFMSPPAARAREDSAEESTHENSPPSAAVSPRE